MSDMCKQMSAEEAAIAQEYDRKRHALLSAASEMLDALEDISAQMNGLEGRTYKWIQNRAQEAIRKAKGLV